MDSNENDDKFYMISVDRIGTCDVDCYIICYTFDEVIESVKQFAQRFCIFRMDDVSILGINKGNMHKYFICDDFFKNFDIKNHCSFNCCTQNDKLQILNKEHFAKRHSSKKINDCIIKFLFKVIEMNDLDDNDDFNIIGNSDKLFKLFSQSSIADAFIWFMLCENHMNIHPELIIKFHKLLVKLLENKDFYKQYQVSRTRFIKKKQ